MRLKKTAVAAVAVLATSGSALAAGTHDEVTTTMGGSSHVAAGGKLRLVIVRKTATAKQFRVTIHYDVMVRSKTVLGFTAYPCKSTSCINSSVSKITLLPSARLRHVTFTGRVPVVRRDDGTACVYAQLRDQGPGGKAPGKIVRRGSSKGVALCRKVK